MTAVFFSSLALNVFAFSFAPMIATAADQTSTYRISGVVFYDRNQNGTLDEGEGRLSAKIIELLPVDSTLGKTVATAQDGSFVFDKIPKGKVRVSFRTPEGHRRTTDDSVLLTLDSDVTRNFGIIDAKVTPLAYPLKNENFEASSSWVGVNNTFNAGKTCDLVKNSFGYLATNQAAGGAGELGGVLFRTVEQTYIGHRFSQTLMLTNRLSAKGKMALKSTHSPFIGWFNKITSKYWRPINMLGFRFEAVYGMPGYVKAVIDYTTSLNRSGTTYEKHGRPTDIILKNDGKPFRWWLDFSPENGGVITLRIDDKIDKMALLPGHLSDQAVFSHFGAFRNITLNADSSRSEFYIDDVLLNTGERFQFDGSDAFAWQGRFVNEKAAVCDFVKEDYGIRGSNPLLGNALGGLVRSYDMPNIGGRVQFYDPLSASRSIARGLYMEGKLVLPVGQADSDALLGWYDGRGFDETDSPLPRNFFGFHIGGNSADGILLEPYFVDSSERILGIEPNKLYHIVPGEKVVSFSLYINAAEKKIDLWVNGKSFGPYAMPEPNQIRFPSVDRFGLLPLRRNGSPLVIYFDEMRYSY